MFEILKSRPKFSIAALLIFVLAFVALAIYIVFISEASKPDNLGPELTIAGEYVPDEIIVRFKPGTRGEKQREIVNKNNLEQIDEIKQIEAKVLKIKDKGNVATKIRALSKNPNIIYAEPNYIVTAELTPNDPYWSNQQHYMQAISAPTGWDVTTGKEEVIIANLDTGVMSTHQDFSGRFVTGYNVFSKDSNTEDDHGHGTVTVGVSSATGNNSLFVAGIDWGSKIMPIKVLSSNGSGTSSGVAQGLNWAADNGAHIANMSLGGTTASNTIENSMNYAHSKGVLLIAAAGNDGTSKLNYPAAYDSVVAVGGLNLNTDAIASWSSYGEGLELMAPGTRIFTTTFNGSYSYASGTSMAAPFVSGLAGLIKAVNPNLTNEQIRTILRETATDLGDPGFDIYYGYGRINAEAAVKKAQGTGGETPPPPPPADTTAPTTSITSPTAGTTVAGAVGVNVDAKDDVGVTKVELLVNNKVYASTTVSPYNFSWDTTSLTNGTYSLTSKAYDAAGNVGTSTAVSINVNNTTATPIDDISPTVSITNPRDGAKVSKRVSIEINATDNVGVTKVEVYINNRLHATLSSAPYTTNWNTNPRNVPTGENIITAIAYDAAGNAASTSVTVIK